jgi:protoporphyrinogen oxidase
MFERALHKRGIIRDLSQIVLEDVQRKDMSYVVYDVDYEHNAQIVRSWFDQIGIQLVGRFSYFEYVNVDMVVERALKVASKMQGQGDHPRDHQIMMKKALDRLESPRSVTIEAKM